MAAVAITSAARTWRALTKTQRTKLQGAPTEWLTLDVCADRIRWPTLRALLARDLVEVERRGPGARLKWRVTDFGREVSKEGSKKL